MNGPQFFLVLALVLGVMAAPILWLRPSPRQRHQTALRTLAMKLGMRVDCPGIQHFKWAKNNKLIDPKRFVRYTLAIDAHHLKEDALRRFKGTYHRWIYRGVEEWQWHEVEANRLEKLVGMAELLEKVRQSSVELVALELGYKSCSVFWHEDGGEDAVTEIHGILSELAQLIVSNIKNDSESKPY